MNRRQLILVAGVAMLAIFTLALKCGDDPPTIPVVTAPGAPLYQNAELAFRLESSQPQNMNVKYVMDWGDGTIDTSTTDFPSGTEATLRHIWTEPGQFQVKGMAFVADNSDLVSDWSDPVSIAIEANEAPTDVRITYAPMNTARNRDARFEAYARDPEGDSIAFQFNYGGTLGRWTTPYVPSGTTVEDFHRFRTLGEFWVKVRARDHKGSMSDWAPDSALVLVDTTGVVAWAWVTQDDDMAPAIGSALVLTRDDKEVIYVGAEDWFGRFYGINAATGRRDVNSSGMDENWFTGHPAYVAATGNIIVGNENGELYAFNLALATQWNWPDNSREWFDYIEWGVPAVNGNRIYATRADDRIYYLTDQGTRGTDNSHYHIPGIKGSPVIDNGGNVMVVNNRGQLYKFDTSLQLAWDTLLNPDSVELNTPVIGAAGHIYLGDNAGNVYAINPNQTVQWKVQVQGEANHIVVGDGALYVTTGVGKVYRLDPTNGSTVWERTLRDAFDIMTSPILTANGMVYIHDDMDVLHCIRQADGSYVWLVNCEEHAPARNRTSRRRNRDIGFIESSPAITGSGDIAVVGLDALYLVAGYTEGTLAPTAWPKWQGGMHNAGSLGSF